MVNEASPAMYKKYSGHTTYEYMVCTGYLTFRSEPPQRPMGSGCGVALTDNWVGNDTRSGPRQFPPWRWCVAPRHSEKPMRHFPSIAAESSMVIITGIPYYRGYMTAQDCAKPSQYHHMHAQCSE